MTREFAAATLIPLLLVLAGCGSTQPRSESSVPPPAPPAAPSVIAPSTSRPTSTAAPESDDLATGKARHVIRSSGVTLSVAYETRKPTSPWTADGEKPLRVEVRVTRPKKKVYLTKVSLRFTTNDGSGEVPGPDPVVDTATNVSPGYLVAPPYSYVQSFAVPALDPSTRVVTIDVKLELVSLVDTKSKDYTKQTVTDTITTTVES